jgi:hypothetical protein
LRSIDYTDIDSEHCLVVKDNASDGEIIKQRGRFYYTKHGVDKVLKVLLCGKDIQTAMLDWRERQYYFTDRFIEAEKHNQELALIEDAQKRFNLPPGTTVNIHINVLKLTINR